MNAKDVVEVKEIQSNGQRLFKVVREGKEYTITRHPRYGYYRVDPYPSENELVEIYKDFDNPTYSFHEYKYLDLLENRLKLCKGDRWKVTEIGCGNGGVLAHFRDHGHETFGFEPGKRDRARCHELGLNVVGHFFDQGVLARQGKQDVIIMTNFLEHVPHPEAFLSTLRQHLRGETGYLLIQVPNEFNPLQEQFIRNSGTGYYFLGPPIHLTYFNPEGLERLLEDCGYVVVHRTCDFPMELFLLSGRRYVHNQVVGKQCHEERVVFEQSLRSNMGLMWDFYDALARVNLGREIVIVAKLKSDARWNENVPRDRCLETARIEIRRLRVTDITEEYIRGLNDPDVNQYMETRHRLQTYETVERYVSENWHDPNAFLFGLFTKRDHRLIGTVRLHNISYYHFAAAMGICLFAKDCWRRGYGLEAIKKVTEFAFSSLGLRHIEASVFRENRTSMALFSKAGFQPVAVYPNKYRFDDRFAEVVIMGTTNPNFNSSLIRTDVSKKQTEGSGHRRSS